jgi:NAD(P)-dependent dehydrogenase (short-subunit alcohol dehydrogenase family)
MKNKTVMITGATAGIGRQTALKIAEMGATVVLVGRNEAKARDVVSAIQQETDNDRVSYLLADLSSMKSTEALAQEYRTRFDRLDVLVNNAGAIIMTRGETVDGFENTFALNHLVGYFYLTNLLLDLLIASAPARIVNVSSGAHSFAKMNFNDLQGKQKYSGFRAYGQSKLANVLFTYELARRLEGTGVTVNALHPGFVASNFGQTNNEQNTLVRLGIRATQIVAISEEQGAETSIYLATSPEVEGMTGLYFDKQQPKASCKESYDVAEQALLWQVSEQLLQRDFPVRAGG